MNKKFISVIIAAYNEERNIDHCISTLISQTITPDEIIVVDDGSTDNTWKILKEIKKNHANIKIFHKFHLEQATARNYGFTKSTGEILVFPDADYYFDPKFIEHLVKSIINGEVIATFTNEEYIANPDNIWSKCWNINAGLPLEKKVPHNNPNKANNFRAILRSAFIKAGGFSETGYSNDITVLNKLGVKDAGLAVKGAICYHYNPDSLNKVFTAAYRKGRKGGVPLNLKNLLIFTPVNSLRKGLIVTVKNHLPQYLLFKLVFDFGIVAGMIVRMILTLKNTDPHIKKLGTIK